MTLSAAPTVGDLVHETRRMLLGDSRIEYTQLAADITSTASTLTMTYAAGGVTAGSYIAIDDEIMYVFSVSGTTVTVARAALGTTAAAHTEDDLIEVNPRFSKFDIKEALFKEIRSWPQDLFQVTYIDVTASRSYASQGLDLAITGDWYYVLDVRHTPDTTLNNMTASLIYSKSWPSVKWFEVLRNAPTTDFASGTGIIINEYVPTGTIRVIYAKPFTLSAFADATTIIAGLGLSANMVDLPPIGAAWRLMSSREVARTDTRAWGAGSESGVPPGHLSSSGNALKQLRDQRLAEEMARLRTLYPMRHG